MDAGAIKGNTTLRLEIFNRALSQKDPGPPYLPLIFLCVVQQHSRARRAKVVYVIEDPLCLRRFLHIFLASPSVCILAVFKLPPLPNETPDRRGFKRNTYYIYI
jgi:hypothetical protein